MDNYFENRLTLNVDWWYKILAIQNAYLTEESVKCQFYKEYDFQFQ